MEGMMSITVKPLEWVPVYYDGRDRVAKTPLGDYVISVDSDLAGGLHYLWVAGQSQDDEHHSVYKTMTAAKFAAFDDYSARIMSTIEPAGVGVETEWKSAWIARGTVVAFPGGGFDVGDCPDPEQLAIFIAEAVNAYRPTASLKGDEQ